MTRIWEDSHGFFGRSWVGEISESNRAGLANWESESQLVTSGGLIDGSPVRASPQPDDLGGLDAAVQRHAEGAAQQADAINHPSLDFGAEARRGGSPLAGLKNRPKAIRGQGGGKGIGYTLNPKR